MYEALTTTAGNGDEVIYVKRDGVIVWTHRVSHLVPASLRDGIVDAVDEFLDGLHYHDRDHVGIERPPLGVLRGQLTTLVSPKHLPRA